MKGLKEVAALLALSAAPAFAQICTPQTRCTDYAKCFINGKAQPCAYGSSGASSGGIMFRHGTFYVDWISDTRAKVTYGKRQEFNATARVSESGGYKILKLSDGVTVKYPISGGRYAGG